MNKKRKLLLAVTVLLTTPLLYFDYVMLPQPIPFHKASYPKTQVDPELMPIIQDLHINPYGLEFKYVDSLPTAHQYGEFDGDRTIAVVQNSPYIKLSLAHEYLHYVWYKKLTMTEKVSVNKEVINLYNQDDGMKRRMTYYSSKYGENGDIYSTNGDTFTTELLSTYCTESSDQYLSQSVLNVCNKWINRGALEYAR